MTKFKVGDTVRVVSNNFDMVLNIGDVAKIIDVDVIGYGVHYYLDPPSNHEGDEGVLFFEEELELATEKETDVTTHIAMIVNSTGCTVVIGSAVHTVAQDHPNFKAIQEAYAQGDAELMENLISVRKSIETFAVGTDLRIEGGTLFYGDRELKSGLAMRIVRMMQEGRENFAAPLVAFMKNVLENPSFRAVDGLYEWLERSSLPITPDGHFIAWKIVNDDFTDCRTHSFDNSPGQVVEIARNQVDENPDRTCSSGLHFCSNEYLPSYGAYSNGRKVVMVKVNPRDVGAFPYDYNISKGRCCRYEVLREVSQGDIDNITAETATGSGILKTASAKNVVRLATRGDRAEITLVFSDGTTQTTKNRLGDTVSFEQSGNTVTLQPSGRTITIN